jgi:hypothetical protein
MRTTISCTVSSPLDRKGEPRCARQVLRWCSGCLANGLANRSTCAPYCGGLAGTGRAACSG